jgi:hypothetical protein
VLHRARSDKNLCGVPTTSFSGAVAMWWSKMVPFRSCYPFAGRTTQISVLAYGNTNHHYSDRFWGLCTSGISDTWESRGTNDGDCENWFGFLV